MFLQLSRTDHLNLSQWSSGTGPAYAVLSRTTNNRGTEATEEEIAALVAICNEAEAHCLDLGPVVEGAHEEEAETPDYWSWLRDFLTGTDSDI